MPANATKVRRLRSECGRYFAERIEGESVYYNLYDRDGNFVCRTSYWSNLYTTARIRFEVGNGPDIKAIFSYPRFPTWFRRRWVLCFDLWIDDLKTLIEGFGGEVLTGFKPDMNCWSHVGFRATSEQLRKIDEELTRRGVEWNKPPCKPGQWDISCPDRSSKAGLLMTVAVS